MKTQTYIKGKKMTQHGSIRKQQRGIKDIEIETVLSLGKIIHKQGLKFFYVPKSLILSTDLISDLSLSRLIVVTDLNQTEIITCYKHEKAIHKIKKKSKRLLKN